MTQELYHKLCRMLEKKEGYILQRDVDSARRILERNGYEVRGPEAHSGGRLGPYERHLKVAGKGKMVKKDNRAKKVHAHIYILQDPSDERLE